MDINTKPVEEIPIFDDVSVIEKGRVRYILEVFPCNQEVKDEEILSRITSQIQSKHQSLNQSKNVSYRQSKNASLNNSRIEDNKNLVQNNLSMISKGSNKSNNLNASKISNVSKQTQDRLKKQAHVDVINLTSGVNKKEKSLNNSKIISKRDKDGRVKEIKKFSDIEMEERFPLININPIPPRRFEIRLIVWNAEDVPAVDLGGNTDA